MEQEYTYDDFDDFGITDEWADEQSYSGDDWWSFSDTNETGDWQDPSTGNGAGFDWFGGFNDAVNGYYNFESNRATRGAQLEQIKLLGATPLPVNTPNKSVGVTTNTLLVAGAVALSAVVLLKVVK